MNHPITRAHKTHPRWFMRGLGTVVACVCTGVFAAETAARRVDFGTFSAAGGLTAGEYFVSCGQIGSGTAGLTGTESEVLFRGVAAWGLWLRPLDTDLDGITDDWDADDDNDGLLDADEVALVLTRGVRTDTRLADTDGDGWADGFELLRGYDPSNPSDVLRIHSIRKTEEGIHISWTGKLGTAYRLRAMADTGETLGERFVQADDVSAEAAPVGDIARGTFVDRTNYGDVRAVLYRIEHTVPVGDRSN